MVNPYRYLSCLVACLISCLLAGCVTTTGGGAVNVNRSQLLLVSDTSINQAAQEEYTKLLQESKQKGVLNQNAATVTRVRNIVNRLSVQTGIFRSDAPQWDWEINVITSDELNAFCYPGGKMIILTGIIQKLNLNDNEIAAILGHEIAHALREHSREQYSQGAIASVAVNAASSKLGALADLLGQSWMMYNSRTAETEADRIGIELMARAGYDPQGAVSLWTKMSNQSGGNNNFLWWLSSHPLDSDRLKVVSADAKTVQPLYEQARQQLQTQKKTNSTPSKTTKTSTKSKKR